MTVPTRCGRLERASKRHPSPVAAAVKRTLAGSSTGCLNDTSTVPACGSRPSSAASDRALVHMPWAIGLGKPKSRAPIRDVWIGLRSPETAA